MPPRKSTTVPETLLPAEKAIVLLAQQRTTLQQQLKGHRYSEVESEEKEWQHVTGTIVQKAFGNTSANPMRFQNALRVGDHTMQSDFGPRRPPPYQFNFEARIAALESLLNAMIKELELFLPDKGIKGVYAPGDEYEFYKDLKTIIETTANSLFIIDHYLDVQLFDLYVEKVRAGVDIRILTDQLRGSVQAVAVKFSKRGRFELRTSGGATHDRHVFLDDRGWVIGQSIKDAAVKKPTYMVELGDPTALRHIYEQIWLTATLIVKS